MIPSSLYQWVLAGPSPEEAIASLADLELCQLSGWLAQDYEENEQTGKALGICLVEQAARFAKRIQAREEIL